MFHDIGVPQVGDHVPTVADCPTGNTRCDCSPGDEKGTCLPAGAWAGLLELSASVEPATGINFNNTRRDSMWSDDVLGHVARRVLRAADGHRAQGGVAHAQPA